MKRALLIVALVLIGAGFAQMLVGKLVKPTSVRVLTASIDLPSGSLLSANSTQWVEVDSIVAVGYLQSLPVAGSVLLESVGRGELVPLRAVGSEPNFTRSIVTIKPLVSPVRVLKVGDIVDVWSRSTSAGAADGATAVPSLIATMAQVVAVSADGSTMSPTTRTVDIAIDKNQLVATVAASLDSQTVLALVRTPSLFDDRKS